MSIDDSVSIDADKIIFQCPNCGDFVVVHRNELNCKIFRHAVYKKNNQNINPHLPEIECVKLLKESLIFGCAKPFKIVKRPDNSYRVQKCGYI
jgi:predicted RNA-binding Zn-ribbon protein involved in translation (DUF1610 family)